MSTSSPSPTVIALNRQQQHKNVSILLILHSYFIVSAQLMILDCGCGLCVISTHLRIIEEREKTDSTGGRRPTFPTFLLYMKAPGESFSVPQATEAFERGRLKDRKCLLERRQTHRQLLGGQIGGVLKV